MEKQFFSPVAWRETKKRKILADLSESHLISISNPPLSNRISNLPLPSPPLYFSPLSSDEAQGLDSGRDPARGKERNELETTQEVELPKPVFCG